MLSLNLDKSDDEQVNSSLSKNDAKTSNFGLGQVVSVLRSNAHWDAGWKIKAVSNQAITLGKSGLTKRLSLKHALFYLKSAEDSPDGAEPSLCQAILHGDKRVVKALVARYGDLNVPEEVSGNKTLPFHLACARGENALVSLMVVHGADPALLDGSGRNALNVASENNSAEVVDTLLDLGLDLQSVSRKDRKTALHFAAAKNAAKAAKVLIQRGINTEAKDANGETALQTAQRLGSDGVLSLLLIEKNLKSVPKSEDGGNNVSNELLEDDELLTGKEAIRQKLSIKANDPKDPLERFDLIGESGRILIGNDDNVFTPDGAKSIEISRQRKDSASRKALSSLMDPSKPKIKNSPEPLFFTSTAPDESLRKKTQIDTESYGGRGLIQIPPEAEQKKKRSKKAKEKNAKKPSNKAKRRRKENPRKKEFFGLKKSERSSKTRTRSSTPSSSLSDSSSGYSSSPSSYSSSSYSRRRERRRRKRRDKRGRRRRRRSSRSHSRCRHRRHPSREHSRERYSSPPLSRRERWTPLRGRGDFGPPHGDSQGVRNGFRSFGGDFGGHRRDVRDERDSRNGRGGFRRQLPRPRPAGSFFVAGGFAPRFGADQRIVNSKYGLPERRAEVERGGPPNLVRERVEKNSALEKINEKIASLQVSAQSPAFIREMAEAPSDSTDSVDSHRNPKSAEGGNLEEASPAIQKKEETTAEKVGEAEEICAVCSEEKQRVLFLPCKHVCCCKECSARMESCPICDQLIENKLDMSL